eukprot:CAMPEP_0116839434 /NCGR_PEP_ID=MMETSP0418-20121206/9767_1 /TAXON_ID=1158023 /ORGANISM="Astrosyne radiata, Strain 13vi08-1A" /LENGTH=150 /DNA_ID=CAMNT_0004469549 /DNA_START=9 /DNA_END=461 /DNA_ORIENTATION=-
MSRSTRLKTIVRFQDDPENAYPYKTKQSKSAESCSVGFIRRMVVPFLIVVALVGVYLLSNNLDSNIIKTEESRGEQIMSTKKSMLLRSILKRVQAKNRPEYDDEVPSPTRKAVQMVQSSVGDANVTKAAWQSKSFDFVEMKQSGDGKIEK